MDLLVCILEMCIGNDISMCPVEMYKVPEEEISLDAYLF